MKTTAKIFTLVLATALLLPTAALAKPQIELAITAEKEVTAVENGQQVIKRVPAAEILPGETVIYTIAFTNSGDEAATNVNIDDPIPDGTVYVPGSATETGEVTFSIDDGQTYKKPSLLTYEVTNLDGSKEKRVATPEQYTHVRWQLPQIAAGAKGEVSFRVKVK